MALMTAGEDGGLPLIWRRSVGRSMDLRPIWQISGPKVASNAAGSKSARGVAFEPEPGKWACLAPGLNTVDLLNVKLSYERAV